MNETASGTTLEVRRTFAADRARVFAAWTTAEGLKRWYAPTDDWVTSVAEVDARVGGAYKIEFVSASGTTITETGVYLEFEPPSKLVYTVDLASDGEHQFSNVVRVDLNAIEGGTEVVVVEEGYPDRETRDHHEAGWRSFLDRLARHALA